MPTLFETFKRIVAGQPVFRPEEGDGNYKPAEYTEPARPQSAAPLFGHAEYHRTDGKIAPIVVITDTNCHIHDERMDLSVVVHNRHTEPVFVDCITIMGRTWKLSRQLQPEEEHEFMFYKGGPRPTDSHFTKAELKFRNANGDYFSSMHYVMYDELHDGRLVVEQLRFLPPIHDI